MTEFMRAFPDRHFDRIICSRTVHELHDPAGVVLEALRVGSTVTVGFVNHGYWKNRLGALFWRPQGAKRRVHHRLAREPPRNPLSIADFEDFCREKSIRIARRAHLLGEPCARPAASVRTSSPVTPSTTWPGPDGEAAAQPG